MPQTTDRDAKDVRHLIIFAVLYASQGGPIGLIWWAVPGLLRHAQVDVATIATITSAAVIPWMTKFAWAPALERIAGGVAGLRRTILISQAILFALIAFLASVSPTDFDLVLTMLLLVAITSATQDIAIDGLAICVTPIELRGRLNAAMQFGLQGGRAIVTGGVLGLSALGGWPAGIAFAAGFIAIAFVIVAIWLRKETSHAREPVEIATFFGMLKRITRPAMVKVALYALVAAAAFEATGGLAAPILVDNGAPPELLGLLYSIGVTSVLTLGGLISGPLADRFGARRVLQLTTVGFSSAAITVAIATRMPYAQLVVLAAAIVTLYLFVGAYTVASYSLYMSAVDQRAVPATQFSFLMACTNACEAWSTWSAGRLAHAHSYALPLLLFSVVSFVSITFVPSVPSVARDSDP